MNPLFTALASFAGPGILGGMLVKILEGSTVEDVYKMAIDNKYKNQWDLLPPDYQEKLRNLNKTTNIVEKLSVGWAIDELKKGKRYDLAGLVQNSPEVWELVEKIIKDLQDGANSDSPV